MQCKRLILIVLVVGLFSCKKENEKVVYKGQVVGQPNSCTSSTGFPFIIYYTTITNQKDSLITTTLPIPFKFIGQKIEFEIRDLNSQDERIACTALFIMPKQAVIFNVSAD